MTMGQAPTPVRRSDRWAVPGLLAGTALVAAALAGYALAAGPRRLSGTGASYPGDPISAAQLVGHFAGTLTGALCLGVLVVIVVTSVPDAEGRIDPAAFRLHLSVERAAICWAVVASAMVVVEAATAAGAPVSRLIGSGAIGDALAASESARGWCAAAVCAAVTAVGSRFTLRWIGHGVLLIPAVIGVLAVPVTGNAGQGPDHDIATSAAIVFAVAVAILVGLTAAAAVGAPHEPALQRRTHTLCAIAGAAAIIYGATLVTLMVTGTPLLASDYGRLALLSGLLIGAVWLTGVVALVRSRRVAGPVTMACALAMIAALGAMSAMATQAPPRFAVHEFTAWDVFLGYELPGPVSVVTLLTTWRFDPFLGVAAVTLGLLYAAGVVRLRRRGDRWPVGRTIAWATGCLAMLLATSSGTRAYGSAMFSVHMGEHMALNMFIPVLLVLGAPITLALRALPAAAGGPPGPREWVMWLVHSKVTAFLGHPVTAFVLFVGSLYAVYFTPLFDTLVRYHWGHELMSVHFLIVGYLFYWGIIGVDPGPRRLPFLGRLGLLFAVMPFHAFFGIATMTMTSVIGGTFYGHVGLPWLESLSDDQQVGGAIAWGTSELPVIMVVVALVAQWARQDRRAGARHDRHSDGGYDDELDAYNEMLRELSRTRR